jgi:hypothetical protein
MAAPFAPDRVPGLRGDGDALVLWAERTARGDRHVAGNGGLRFLFYGRVSTEDWQDRSHQGRGSGSRPGRWSGVAG